MKHLSSVDSYWPETALIWGAGATAGLGLPVTEEIGKILSRLAGISDRDMMHEPLRKRINKAFAGKKVSDDLKNEIENLLLLLFDGDGAPDNRKAFKKHDDIIEKLLKKLQKGVLKKYKLTKRQQKDLEYNLRNLHRQYDWVGVRSIAKYIARKWQNGKRREFELYDFLTTVDQLYKMNLAIPTEELFYPKNDRDETIYMIGENRLLNVKKCLTHLMSTIQRMLFQDKAVRKKILPYWTIAQHLAQLMEEESGEFFDKGYPVNKRKFYLFSYALISFNWDPIILWLIFKAHKDINDKRDKIHVKSDKILRLFNDAGDGIGFRKIPDKHDDANDLFALMMNEQACITANNPNYAKDERIMRIGKILFPHAGFGWRICPRCGKLFTDFGDNWEEDVWSSLPFGPDLLPGFQQKWHPRTIKEEKEWQEGNFGAMQCIFCGAMTHPSDCPLILQSAIKSDRHYVLDGIFREMGLIIGNARHLVFAGYGLPKDDFIYKCFFQSSLAGQHTGDKKKYCSLVTVDKNYRHTKGKVWLKNDDIKKYLSRKSSDEKTKSTIENLLQIIDQENIRISFYGVPDIITKHPSLSPKEALKDLLYPDGFPPNRDKLK
jgi:hypothetical protein